MAGSLDSSGQALVLAVEKGRKSDENITAEKKKERDKIDGFDRFMEVWRENKAIQGREAQLKGIRVFLETLRLPEGLTKKTKQLFLQHTSKFFLQGNKMW